MRSKMDERGAAAVEFAFIVPVLIVLVLGIAEFGRAYNVQTTLTQAARAGVRSAALYNNPATARQAAKDAALPMLTLTDSQVSFTPGTTPLCPTTTSTSPAPNVSVTITYPLPFMTSFFGSSITLKGKGVMKCNG